MANDTGRIDEVYATVKKIFKAGDTRDLKWRKAQLQAVVTMMDENKEALLDALYKDLRKSRMEAYMAEIGNVKAEANEALNNLQKWNSPVKVSTPLVQVKGMSTSEIVPMPLGTVLIISPWNYPLQLTMCPVIGAIASGCTAVVKPSELSGNTSAVMATLFEKYLDASAFQIIQGGPECGAALLKLQWDKIFFTGSTRLGKIVYKAAAEHLTPVVLELGGKSPCIVDKDTDFEVMVKRIVSGRYSNCGQTCIAPDYVLIHEDAHDAFVQRAKEVLVEFYGEDPKANADFGRVISKGHVERLKGLLMGLNEEATVVCGGADAVDEADLYVPPTLVTGVSSDTPMMKEEIFGPILPVIKVKSVQEAIDFVAERPHPLASYIFSRNAQTIAAVRDQVLSGGMCANDTIMHIAVPELPFGGVGDSGFGSSTGKAAFDSFVHKKSFLNKTTWFDMAIRYPPYTQKNCETIEKLL